METTLSDLTEYQLKFVDEFMKTGNKLEALKAAGYKGKGKHSTMTSQANRIFKIPKVKAEIERRRKELAGKNIVDAQAIVERLTKMFNGELTSEYLTKKGEVVDIPISFKNQIEAAKVLVNILGIQAQMQQKPEEKDEIKKMAEDLKELTNSFLSKRVTVEKQAPLTIEGESGD